MKLKNICIAVVALALAAGMTACGGSASTAASSSEAASASTAVSEAASSDVDAGQTETTEKESDDVEKGAENGDDKVTEIEEPPLDKINERLNGISDALLHGDVQAIRSGARALSGVADRYGMHTLADMARCFRAAWEEGDVEAAAQIVEEMRAEVSRL